MDNQKVRPERPPSGYRRTRDGVLITQAEYSRLYRLNNHDKILAKDRKRWKEKRRYVRRAKTLRGRRCVFCELPLSSKTVSVKKRKYCDTCNADPRIHRYLFNLYMRRWRQKKAGLPQEPVEYKLINFKMGRKPTKSIIPQDA